MRAGSTATAMSTPTTAPSRRNGSPTSSGDLSSLVTSYLLVLGERVAVAWVLTQRRMAFPELRRTAAARLSRGDAVFIYTTRGCWHNPTRDRGVVIGQARIQSRPSRVDPALEIAGR